MSRFSGFIKSKKVPHIMEEKKFFGAIRRTLLLLGVIFFIFVIEQALHLELYILGVRPRSWEGLIGIMLAPLIHGDLDHLFSNTLILLVLLFGLFYHLPKVALSRLITISIITNLWVWIAGRGGTYHIGASGVAYGLFFYLVIMGLRTGRRQLLFYALSTLILSVGFFAGLIPLEQRISYESHVLGSLAGILVAIFEKKPPISDPERFMENEPNATLSGNFKYEYKDN